ncbi:MAG: transporter substrate-binding domain-containing protein [Desulfatiglandaceae bacterium]
MKKLCLPVVLILITISAFAQELKIVTENYPPYNYEENGKVKGVSTEIVRAVLKEMGLNIKITVYPWARTYRLALEEPNTLIYSIARTPEREHKFKWVGVIAPADQVLLSLKERTDIKLNNLDDTRKYKIGTVRDDVIEHHLLSNGFKVGKNIDRCNNYNSNIKKLLRKRIDLCAIGKLVGYNILRKIGHEPGDTVKQVYRFDVLSKGVNMAFQKDTPDEVVNKFRRGLKKIKENKTYDKILSKYF